MTRKKFIASGVASILAANAAAKPAYSLNGGRSISRAFSTSDDETYAEILKNLLHDTFPNGTTLELKVTYLRQWALAALTSVNHIVVHGLKTLNGGYILQNSSVEVAEFPDMTSCTTFWAYGASKLKTIICPNLSQNMNYLCYIGTSVLSDVYISNSTCEQILAIPYFPGTAPNQNSNYANIVFHGSDGNVVYNGSQWVATNAK